VEDLVAESQMNFGDMSFSGGIQNFGGTNTNTQHNYYELSPREQVESQLATLRAAYPDPALAEPQIVVIERALEHPSVESRGRVEAALRNLAENAGSVRTVLEATAAIGALVAASWPF
jgi:hypothetical protein